MVRPLWKAFQLELKRSSCPTLGICPTNPLLGVRPSEPSAGVHQETQARTLPAEFFITAEELEAAQIPTERRGNKAGGSRGGTAQLSPSIGE